jgi:hypothetical protein
MIGLTEREPNYVAALLLPTVGVVPDALPDWCPPLFIERIRPTVVSPANDPTLLLLLSLTTELPCRVAAAGWFLLGMSEQDIQVLTGWDAIRTRDTIAAGLHFLTTSRLEHTDKSRRERHAVLQRLHYGTTDWCPPDDHLFHFCRSPEERFERIQRARYLHPIIRWLDLACGNPDTHPLRPPPGWWMHGEGMTTPSRGGPKRVGHFTRPYLATAIRKLAWELRACGALEPQRTDPEYRRCVGSFLSPPT